MIDPLSPHQGLSGRLVLAGFLCGLIWLGVWWAS